VSREELDGEGESAGQGAGKGLGVGVAGNGRGEARALAWRLNGARLRRAGRGGGAPAVGDVVRERQNEGRRASSGEGRGRVLGRLL
jgi:hypothetical protein